MPAFLISAVSRRQVAAQKAGDVEFGDKVFRVGIEQKPTFCGLLDSDDERRYEMDDEIYGLLFDILQRRSLQPTGARLRIPPQAENLYLRSLFRL